MEKAAVDKARKRLGRAKDAFVNIQDASDWKEFEPAWTDLLHAGNNVHTLLEQGAKVNPQSRQWFGGKKKDRRADALLSYMHQARNSDEHGIEPIVERVAGAFEINTYGRPAKLGYLEITREGINYSDGVFLDDGSPLLHTFTPPSVKLVRVIDDRYKTSFDPPAEHLGKPLTDTTPKAIAELWLTYLESVLLEAEQL